MNLVNDDLIFRTALLTLFVGFVAHRAYYTRKLGSTEQAELERPAGSRLERSAELLAIPGLLSVSAYVINPEWMAWAALPMPTWLRLIGIGLAVLGFALLQWSQITLGKNWSDRPRITEEQELVTDGPYRWIRHPIYTAFLMIMTATLFISANWFIGLVWIGLTTLDIRARIGWEEEMLEARFGEPYREYQKETGALLPSPSRRTNHA